MSAFASVLLSDLKAKATMRADGYYEAITSRGTISGDKLYIEVGILKEMAEKWHPMGLGSYIAKIAKPIARGIDSVIGTDLEHCDQCAAREAFLNKHFPLH